MNFECLIFDDSLPGAETARSLKLREGKHPSCQHEGDIIQLQAHLCLAALWQRKVEECERVCFYSGPTISKSKCEKKNSRSTCTQDVSRFEAWKPAVPQHLPSVSSGATPVHSLLKRMTRGFKRKAAIQLRRHECSQASTPSIHPGQLSRSSRAGAVESIQTSIPSMPRML